MIECGKEYVVNCDNWFVGSDGETYKAVWGTVEVLTTEDCFGFKPLRPSTNWFLKVGSEDCHVIVAGCQVHYAVRCDDEPKDRLKDVIYKEKDTDLERLGSRLFIAGVKK